MQKNTFSSRCFTAGKQYCQFIRTINVKEGRI